MSCLRENERERECVCVRVQNCHVPCSSYCTSGVAATKHHLLVAADYHYTSRQDVNNGEKNAIFHDEIEALLPVGISARTRVHINEEQSLKIDVDIRIPAGALCYFY